MKKFPRHEIELFHLATDSKPSVPMVENIAVHAGFPSPVDDAYMSQPIDLNKELIAHPATSFIVRVVGDSMIEEGIEQGDLLVAKAPFDGRICHQAEITDMSKLLIGDYLNRVGSSITESDLERMSMEEICRSMHIASGPTEFFKPKNVGLLFFSHNAEKYIPYARIEIVHFHDDVGDHFDEKVLHGPIHLQYDEAMRYLNSVLVEKVMKVEG